MGQRGTCYNGKEGLLVLMGVIGAAGNDKNSRDEGIMLHLNKILSLKHPLLAGIPSLCGVGENGETPTPEDPCFRWGCELKTS